MRGREAEKHSVLRKSVPVSPDSTLFVQVCSASESISWFISVSVFQVHGGPGGLPRVGLCAQPPSGRGLLHMPRLSVAFTLPCAYACLAALVTAAGHELVRDTFLIGAPGPSPAVGCLPDSEVSWIHSYCREASRYSGQQ